MTYIFPKTRGRISSLSYTWIAVFMVISVSICLTVIAYLYPGYNSTTIGTRFDVPFTQSGFYEPELAQNSQRPFRWTTQQATLNIPRFSSGAVVATFSLAVPPITAPTQPVSISFNESTTITFNSSAEIRHIYTYIPGNAQVSGDVSISFDVPSFKETTASQRMLGLSLFAFSLRTVDLQTGIPPLASIILMLAISLGSFITLSVLRVHTLAASFIALSITFMLTVGLISQRAIIALYLPRLAMLMLFSIGIAFLFQHPFSWAMKKAHIVVAPPVITLLGLIAIITFWIKAGGVLYPYMIPIDVKWHMDKVRWIFNGQFGDLYGGKLNELVMPVEWGAEKPIIPYSPFYHFFAASFRVFPWAMELTASVFSIFIDTTYILIIFFFVRKIGFTNRAGIIAATIYAIIPSTYLLHSWGNVPTTFGIWWTVVAITWIVAIWEDLPQNRAAWWGLVIILSGAFLFYTVMAVFMGMFMLLLLGFMLCLREHRLRVRSAAGAMGTALLVVTALFYWQYIEPTITQTIPLISGRVAQGGENLGEVSRPFSAYVREQLYLWDIYGVYLPLIFGIGGWWFIIRTQGKRSVVTWTFVAWIIVAVIWWFAGYKVDTVDKQLFWLIPAMAIGGGAVIDRLISSPWRRLIVPLVVVCLVYLVADALYLWLYRIEHVQGFTSLTQEALRWLGIPVRGAFS